VSASQIHKLVKRKAAYLSPCREYRYALWRWWDESKLQCVFVGLNPSTADETADDPTIRRCIRFAHDWGYGSLCMINLFALRATKPSGMLKHPEPVGPENDVWIKRVSYAAGITVAAWGVPGAHCGRDREVALLLKDPYCLARTKDGFPGHPLYLPAACTLQRYP
jgi:hypothetical protein